jgi:hypothetical protein
MKGEVLATLTPKKDETYVSNFKRIVLNTSPCLSVPEIESLCSEKPIIGQVLEDCFDYKIILSLKRLEKFDKPSGIGKVWLVAKNISGKCGLGVGYKNNVVEIFQEHHDADENQYFLTYFNYYNNIYRDERTKWLKPPQDFLQKTFDLLPEISQRNFENLIKLNP